MALGDNIKRNTQEQKTFNEAINEGALAYREYEDLFRSIQAELGKKTDQIKNATKSYDQLISATSQLKLNEEEITRLSDKQIQQNEDKAKAAIADLKHSASLLSIEKNLLIQDAKGNVLQDEALENKIKELIIAGDLTKEEAALLRAKATNFELEEEMVAKAGQDVEKRKKLNKALGVTGGLLKGMTKLAGPFADSLGLDEVQKDMEKFAEGAIKANKPVSRLQTLGVGIRSAFGQLKTTLTDPAVIIGSIVKTFGKFEAANKEVRQLTGQTAVNFENYSSAMSATAGSALSLVDYTKAVGSLSKEIGINVGAAFGSDTIAAAAEMTELLGVGAAETAQLAMNAEAFGQDLSSVPEAAENITKEFALSGKGALNMGDVLKEAGSASGALSLSLKGNPDALVKAAAGAKALGINLQQAEAIADSLLDFQSSIEAEMEAELLTGKQINLEKARMAALNNDMATLTEEIANNTEIQEAFSSGNRIQQAAIAKSLGMSKDQVAKMIVLKKIAGGMTEEEAAKAADISIEEAKRLSVQDSINKSIEKMTAAFAPLLDVVAKLVSSKGGMLALQGIIGVLVATKAVSGAKELSKSFKDMKNDLQDMGKFLGGKGKQLVSFLKGDKIGGITKDAKGRFRDAKGRFAKNPMAKTMDKGAEVTGKIKKKTEGAGDKGPGGFLKSLGDGLASIGKKFADVVKGGLALGIVGVILGGSFALAMKMVENVDPVQMIAFSAALAIFGATAAIIGKLGSQVMQGAAALLVMGLALVPAAFAFSLLEGLDTNALIAFSISLPLLALAAAGLGFIAPFILAGSVAIAALGLALIPAAIGFNMIQGLDIESIISFASGIGILATTAALMGLGAPLILLGSVALAALGVAMIPLAMGFEKMAGANTEGLVTSIAQFAALAPGLTATAAALFAVAGGLGAMALAGIAALPVMTGLAGLGTVATGISSIFGGDEEGGEEATPKNSDNTILAEKLDQMNVTLNAILNKEGTVTLDSTKVGTALTVGSYKLQ